MFHSCIKMDTWCVLYEHCWEEMGRTDLEFHSLNLFLRLFLTHMWAQSYHKVIDMHLSLLFLFQNHWNKASHFYMVLVVLYMSVQVPTWHWGSVNTSLVEKCRPIMRPFLRHPWCFWFLWHIKRGKCGTDLRGYLCSSTTKQEICPCSWTWSFRLWRGEWPSRVPAGQPGRCRWPFKRRHG